MSKLFSVDATRYLIVWSAISLGLAVITAMIAPLLVDGSWSLSRSLDFVPLAIGTAFILMLGARAYDAADRYPFFKVWIWPRVMAGTALVAGVAFLIELPLAQALRPWIFRRDLSSIIFAVASSALAFAVAFSYWRSRVITFPGGGELFAELRAVGVHVATFIALFVIHAVWLGGVEEFARAIQRDARVNMVEMVLATVVPLLAIGALVGYCFNAALSESSARRYGILNDDPDVIKAHDFVWFDYAPRRPFRTIYEERSAKTLPVLVVFTLTGLVVGYVIWPQQWFGSALGCACLGLLASSGYAAIIHWRYRHADLAGPSATTILRRAFIQQTGDRLDFVVTEDDGSSAGRIQAQLPWSDVQEFSKDSYNSVFGLTHSRPFNTDWNVVKVVPTNGGPLMVAETLAGDAEVYAITSKLTNLFGAKARDDFLQKRSVAQPYARDHGGFPSEL